MPPWWVYIVEAKNKKLYTGITTSVERRLRQHRQGPRRGGAKFFSLSPVKRLLWKEKHSTRSLASKRERAIKRLSRKEKDELIKGS